MDVLRRLPGADLLRQAWDATKLAGRILDIRKEKAVVLSNANKAAVQKFRGKEANRQIKQLFLDAKYEDMTRLYLPSLVVDKGKELLEAWWKIWDIYWMFLALRAALVLFPQPGYIHPDEFFQSVEVVVGDVFETKTVRTWEFDKRAPVRSMTLPAVIFGGPLYAVKLFDLVVAYLLPGSFFCVVTPYLVTVVPRLVMLVLSLAVDWCVYQICVLYRHNYNQCLTTLASSYVMVIYSTRTFSNSIEMVLLAVLLYLVAHCMKRTAETVYLQALVHDAYEKAESVRERVQVLKRKKLIPPHDFTYALPISVLCALGFFNRPTFAAFAFVPLFFWFQRGVGIDSHISPFQMFNFRMLALAPGFVLASLILILSDSLYYGDLTLKKLWDLEMDWSDWKCTPFNFIMYNASPDNLDKHGTHPFYLHALVNVPLLFGPIGLVGLVSACQYLTEIVINEWSKKPAVRNVYALTMFTFLVSLGILSLVPHQEPRFLLPLTVPLVLMGAHRLRTKLTFGGGKDSSKRSVEGNKANSSKVIDETKSSKDINESNSSENSSEDSNECSSNKGRSKSNISKDSNESSSGKTCKGGSKPLLLLWYIFNIGMILFYGFVHQSGIPRILDRDDSLMTCPSQVKNVNLLFSHTYSPPWSPLLMKGDNVPSGRFPFEYPLYYRPSSCPTLNVIEMGSASVSTLAQKMIELSLVSTTQGTGQTAAHRKNFLVVPSILRSGVKEHVKGILDLETVSFSFPFISIESFASAEVFSSESPLNFLTNPHFTLGKALEDLNQKGVIETVLWWGRSLADAMEYFGLAVVEFKLSPDGVKALELRPDLNARNVVFRPIVA